MNNDFEEMMFRSVLRGSDASNKSVVSLAVSGILNSCENVEPMVADTEGGLSELDNIRNCCSQIVRAIELNGMLSAKNISIRVVPVDELLDEFVERCREFAGDTINLTRTGEQGQFVKGDRTLIEYILLCGVRDVIDHCGRAELNVGAERSGGLIKIFTEPAGEAGAVGEDDAYFRNYIRSVCTNFAERTGASFTYESGRFIVGFSEMLQDDMLSLSMSSDYVEKLEEDAALPFEIMLGIKRKYD